MKFTRPFLAAAMLTTAMATTAVAQQPADKATQPEQTAAQPAMSEAEVMLIISYSIGQQMANFIKQSNLDADIENVKAGLTDGVNGAPARYTDEQLQQAAEFMTAKMQAEEAARQQAEMAAVAEMAAANQKTSEAFLAENQKKPGVKVTASGLQYKVISAGQGAKPSINDSVKVHYHGTLPNGTVFDSSVERNAPIDFPVNGVIEGWQEGLQLMNVGSKYMFYIPAGLAYGNRGSGPVIGPNQALVFEVELLAIQ